MALTTVAGGTIDPTARQFYDMMLIEQNRDLLVHEQFGSQRSIAKRNGKTINFRYMDNFPVITAPLAEGVNPTPRTASITGFTATVRQFGDSAGVTDWLDGTATDPVLNEIVSKQSLQMVLSRDTIIRDAIVPAAANLSYADTNATLDGANDAAVVVGLYAAHLDLIIRAMKNNNAAKVTEIIRPGTGYDSAPVRAAYWLVVHTNVSYTIETFDGFVGVEHYASTTNILPGEIGSYKDLRIIETTNAYWRDDVANGVGADDAYYCACFGEEAFAVVGLDGMSTGTYTQGFGEGDDLLHLRALAGWKMALTAQILKDENLQVFVVMDRADV